MGPRPRNQRRARFGYGRVKNHLDRIGRRNARLHQRFARQIEPADRRVFIEIAQDIGQLQRTAKMMGQQYAVSFANSEHAHREPSDRARHAIAIQIEGRKIRSAHILRHVHFHAVNDRQKILLL